MKFEIISPFHDKYDKRYYKMGEIVEFTEKRSKEILDSGKYIKKVGTKKASKLED